MQGTLIEADALGAVVEMLFACRGCLSILRGIQRHGAGGAVRHDREVTCEISGEMAYRVRQRLEEALPEDRVAVFADLARDPEQRLFLRVVEVFQAVRPLYRDQVRLLDDAVCGWDPSDAARGIPWPPLIRFGRFGREVARVGRLYANPFDEVHRTEARERGEPSQAVIEGVHFLLLPEGTTLRLHQLAKNVLLLVGPGGEPMAAPPDLCVPQIG